MAAYDYQCQTCQHVFEVEKSFKAPAPKKCPNPKCKQQGNIEIYFKKVAAFHTFYSPLHPRRNRGIGNT